MPKNFKKTSFLIHLESYKKSFYTLKKQYKKNRNLDERTE